MNICISPESLKLFSSYINRQITINLDANVTAEKLLQNLYNKSNSLLSDNSLGAERNKEIILQHFAIVPSLVQKQISDNPLKYNNAVATGEIQKAATLLINALSNNDENAFSKVFDNLNSLVNNTVIIVPTVDETIDEDENNRFTAITNILYRIGNLEVIADNIKSNIPAKDKQWEFSIIRNIINTDNKEQFKFQLIKVSDLEKNPNYKNTIPSNFINQPTHVLVLIDSNDEVVLFNSDGTMTKDNTGSFTGFHYKISNFQLKDQQKRLIVYFMQLDSKISQAVATAKAEIEIEKYLNTVNEIQNLVNSGQIVKLNIDLAKSQDGFINQDRQNPVMLSNIVNIKPGGAEIFMGIETAAHYPLIKPENGNKTHKVFGKALSSLSDEELNIILHLINSDVIKTKNTITGKEGTSENDANNKLKLRDLLLNFYLQYSKNGYGFRYYEVKGERYVDFYNVQHKASSVTLEQLKAFANSTEKDKLVDDQKVDAFDSIADVTQPGQYYKKDGKVYERNNVRLNFTWKRNNTPTDIIHKVPIGMSDGVILLGDTITFQEHIIKNGYTVAQVNDQNNFIAVGGYLVFKVSADSFLDIDPDAKFQSTSINKPSFNYSDKQNDDALEWFTNSLFFKNKVLKLILSKNVSEMGPQFLASFIKDAITLYKGSQYVDIYHESFHAFFDSILTEKERTEIYTTLRKTPGSFTTVVYGESKTVKFSEASNIEIEEYLAEKFKEFAASDGIKSSVKDNKILSFFKKLFNILKGLFGNISVRESLALAKTKNLENLLFSQLYNQEFDISKFTPTAQDVKYKSIENNFESKDVFNIQEVATTLESMDSFVQEFKQALTISNGTLDGKFQEKVLSSIFIMAKSNFGSPEYLEAAARYKAFELDNLNRSYDFIRTKQNLVKYKQKLLIYIKKRFEQNLNNFKELAKKDSSTTILNKIKLLEKIINDKNFSSVDEEGNFIINEIENSEYSTFAKLYFAQFTKLNKNNLDEPVNDKVDYESWYSSNDDSVLAEETVNETIIDLLSGIHDYSQNGLGVPIVNNIGAIKTLGWKQVYSKLLTLINGETDAVKISEKLFEASKTDFVIKQVFNMLGNIHTDVGVKNQSVSSANLWTLFNQAVSKASIRQTLVSTTQTIDFTGDGTTEGFVEPEIKITQKIGNFSQEKNYTKSKWANNFIENLRSPNYTFSEQVGQDTQLKIKYLFDFFNESKSNKDSEPKTKYYGLISGSYLQDELGNFPPKIINQKDKALLKKWKDLGVDYTNNVYAKAMADPILFLETIGIELGDVDKIRTVLFKGEKKDKFESKGLQYIWDSLKNRQRSKYPSSLKITKLEDLFKGFKYINEEGIEEEQADLSGVLKQLQELFLEYNTDGSKFIDYNADKERVSEKQYYSSATLIANNLNKSKSLVDFLSIPGMAYLDPEVNYTAASSSWFIKMFNLNSSTNYGLRNPNIKVNITNLGGSTLIVEEIRFKNTEEEDDETLNNIEDDDVADRFKRPKQTFTSEKGKVSIELDDVSKAISDVSLTLRNHQEIMRSETKSTSLVFNVGGEELLIPQDDITKINSENYKSLLMYNHFKILISAELIRINQIKNLINLVQKGVINADDLVIDVDFLKRGSTWIQFDKILSVKVKKDLEKQLEVTSLTDQNNRGKYNIDGISAQLKEQIEKDIITYIKNSSENFEEVFEELTLPEDVLNKFENDDLLKQTFLLNNLIQNFNYQNLFLGDSANFDIENDKFHKRIHGLIASGKIFRNDKAYLAFINNGKFKNPFGFTNAHTETLDKNVVIEKPYWDGTINTGVLDEIMSTSVLAEHYALWIGDRNKPYTEMEEANGQAYISFDLYRILSDAIGEWSIEQENLYQKLLQIQKGESVNLNETDMNTTFTVKKFQQFGNVQNKETQGLLESLGINFSNTSFHKYSLLPLIPIIIKDSPALKLLSEKMMEQNIGYVTLNTGSKTSTLTKVKLENNELKKIPNKFYDGKTRSFEKDFIVDKNTIHVSSLKSQKFIKEGFKLKVKIPTQVRKVLVLNIIDNNDVPFDYKKSKPWKSLTESEQKSESKLWAWKVKHDAALTKLTKALKTELLEDIDFKETIVNGKKTYTGDNSRLLQYIQDNLNIDEFLPEQLEFIKKPNGELIDDLSLSLISKKIEDIIVNLVDKKIRSIEMHGESLINVAGTMFEKEGTLNPTAKDIEKYGTGGLTATFVKDPITGKPLLDKNGNGVVEAMTVKIALHGDFKLLLKTKLNNKPISVYIINEEGKRELDYMASLANLNKAIKDEDWLKENKKFITLPGVRIPVQGPNALAGVSVGEFLPFFAGPIVILPAEIVAMSGSDYDVDTIFMMYKKTLLINNKVIEIKHDDTIKETVSELLEQKKVLLEKKKEVDKKINTLYDENNESIKTNTEISNYITLIKENKQEIANIDSYIENIFKNKSMFYSKKIEIEAEYAENREKLLEINRYYQALINEIKTINIPKELVEQQTSANNAYNNIIIKIASKGTAGIENELHTLFIERILMKENFEHVVLPNSTTDVKKIAEEAAAEVAKKEKKSNKKFKTNVFEYQTNLQKHQEYSVGIDTLGMAAVATTFYAVFSTFNASLVDKTKEEEEAFKKALSIVKAAKVGIELNNAIEYVKTFKEVKLRVPHNINDKTNSLSIGMTNNLDGKNIGDILSQLVNAYVDIASNPFIFYAQGNKENTPVLLFMVMAGVSVKNVISISNNVLVRNYNKNLKRLTGIYSKLKTGAYVDDINEEAIKLVQKKFPLIFKGSFDKAQTSKLAEEFTAKELFAGINSEGTKRDVEIFAEYLKIKEMSQDLNRFIQVQRYDTNKINSLSQVKKLVTDIEDLKDDANKYFPNTWFDGVKQSPIGVFDQYDFYLEMFLKFFKIRNSDSLINKTKKLKNVPGQKRENVINAFKNDFVWFLYQNSIYTQNTYTVSSSDSNPISFEMVVDNNRTFKNALGYEIDYENKKIIYNTTDIFKYLGANNLGTISRFFNVKTPKELARFILEYESLLKNYLSEDVDNQIIKDKFYHFDNYKKTFIEVEDDYNMSGRINLMVRAALYNTNNVNAMFDSIYGIGRILKNLEFVNSDLAFFQFFQDKDIQATKSSNKENIFFREIKDAKKAELYKQNIEDLKNHSSPQVREFFEKFNHIAFMQTGLNSGSKYDLAKLADNNVFESVINDALPVGKLQELLNTKREKGVKLNLQVLDQFFDIFKEVSKSGNFLQRVKGVNYTVDEFKLDLVSEKRDIEGFNNNISVVGKTTILQPGVIELFATDFVNATDLNAYLESLDPNQKYAIRDTPIITKTKTAQAKLNKALLSIGIDNSGDVIKLVYGEKNKVDSPVQIQTSEVQKGWYFVKDSGMAAASSKIIAQKIMPLQSNYESSSNAYIDAVTNKNKKAVDNNFSSKDVVWIFGAGIFKNAYGNSEQKYTDTIKSTFENYYKKNIDKAINAGVTAFVVGDASGIDTLAKEYLKSKGFLQIIEYGIAGSYNKYVKTNTDVSIKKQNFDPFATTLSLKDNSVLNNIINIVYPDLKVPDWFDKSKNVKDVKQKILDDIKKEIINKNVQTAFKQMLTYSTNSRLSVKNNNIFFALVEQVLMEARTKVFEAEAQVNSLLNKPVDLVTEKAKNIYNKINQNNKTQSKNVVLPSDLDENTTYTGKNFWNNIVPEARDLFDNKMNRKTGKLTQMLIAFRGNSEKSFLQNYRDGMTVGNPFDWQQESGSRDDAGKVSTMKFIHWMTTGDSLGNINATDEYRQAIINDIISGKIKGSSILYYQEKNYATHATALDYLINEYDWAQPTQSSTSVVKRTNKIILRSELKANPKTLYLFGDNDIRKGLGGQAKEMRGEPNAIGVSTKKLPARGEEAYKSDAELEKNKKIITDDINKAIAEWNTGKYNKLIIPQMGVGLAELPTRAPETYKFLQQELKRLEDQVTQSSTSVGIEFQEEPTKGYIERTKKNASADATIDFGLNQEGESWTKKAVDNNKKKYIGINTNNLTITPEIVNKIVNALNSVNAKTLNIAGMGIYNMKQYTQEQVDDFTYDLLNQVLNSPDLKTKIESIRSGGQTGFDEAGAKASMKLGLPTIVLAPNGWTYRDVNSKDISNKEKFIARFKSTQSSTSVENIQPGLDLYKNALTKEEQKEFYEFGKSVLEQHGYNPFPGYVMASAGQMEWSPEIIVNKKGKLENRGENYNKKIISHKKIVKGTDGTTGNRFTYHYYLSNLDGSDITPIPANIITSLEKVTGQNMSDYDTVLINLYPIGRTLGWHVDVSEDYRNLNRDIISVSIGADADFHYANTPDNFISGDPEKSGYAVKSKNLKSGDIITFGSQSRLISHTVKNVSGTTDLGPINLNNSNVNEFFDGGLNLDNWRMNFTFRVADPVNNKGKKIKSTQASTTSAVIINSWSDMNFTAAQEKEVLASLIARFKDFNLYSNEQIINNFNTALAKAKTPEEKNKLIELLNCK